LIRFRLLCRSINGRRMIARELRFARHFYVGRVPLKDILLEARSNAHFDFLHFTRRRDSCRARSALMAEDVLSMAIASLDGSIPLPPGFTLIQRGD
jgi:hypothetical protein